MRKLRVKYKKLGRGAYLSHLDTMRTLQRVIGRAEIEVKHSEGFNPHPYLSIALPLSLGYTSECEFMDIVVLNDISSEEICRRLNAAAPEGFEITEAYENGTKVGEIGASQYIITFEYDNSIPSGAAEKIGQLFTNKPLSMIKKSKSGEKEVDLTEFIKKISVKVDGSNLIIDACLCAGNDNLNPEYIFRAVEKYLPECTPDFAKYHRIKVFDKNLKEFR